MSNAAPPPQPRQLTRFEASLVRLARACVGQFPREQALKLLKERQSQPPCLSTDALHVLRDSLRKGVMLFLVRLGAWHRESYLRGETPRTGRLWERSTLDELALRFSPESVKLLLWLTATKPGDTSSPLQLDEAAFDLGDRLLVWLAYRAFQSDADTGRVLRTLPIFQRSGLVRMSFPNDFAGLEKAEPPDFAPLFRPESAWLLEVLTPHWQEVWTTLERNKGTVNNWDEMRAEAQAQQVVLAAFMAAADAARRRDLPLFLLRVLDTLLPETAHVSFWIGGMRSSAPMRLADRMAIQRAALVVVQQIHPLSVWFRQSRGTGFMDDDYPLHQFFLKLWEQHHGDRVAGRAVALLESLEPLRPIDPGD